MNDEDEKNMLLAAMFLFVVLNFVSPQILIWLWDRVPVNVRMDVIKQWVDSVWDSTEENSNAKE